MLRPAFFALSALALLRTALGSVVWSGDFDPYANVATFDQWSWSNQVGEYQWYIHGTQPTAHYLATGAAYKNPADTSEAIGLKLTVDGTSGWNSNYGRTELIPQTKANIGTGHLYYHFSVSHTGVNPPTTTYEHQVLFFESHFTEFKIGVAPNVTNLIWHVQSQPKYAVPFTAGTWYNFAYDIDFSGGTVALWASTGADPLVQVAGPLTASASSNSQDFHVGVLRLASDAVAEDWYISGVYVESAPLTTAIGSGAVSGSTTTTTTTSSTSTTSPSSTSSSSSASSSSKSSSSSSSTKSSSSSSPSPASTHPWPTTSSSSSSSTSTSSAPSSSSTAVGTVAHWGQCGGTGYTGGTVCVSPYTCTAVSAPYYYQCL